VHLNERETIEVGDAGPPGNQLEVTGDDGYVDRRG